MLDLANLEAIFFDADDTLYRVNGSVGSRYAIHLEAHGHKVTPEEVDAVILTAWKRLSGTYENYEGGHKTSHERDKAIWYQYVTNVMDELFGTLPSDQLFQDIYDEFGRGHSRELQPHVEPFLKKLKATGLTTGVLTNNDRRIHSLIPELGLADYFDHVFCAADIGFKKPSRKLFDGVALEIGVAPEKILYIGDCPKNDIEGGKNAGWQVLHYSRSKNPLVDEEPEKPNSAAVECFSELVESLHEK